MISFSITNDSIAVVYEGKSYTVRKGAANFVPLRAALIHESWEDVPAHLTVKKSIEDWARGDFTVEGSSIRYKDVRLPDSLNKRILEMAAKGESPEPFFAFWERVQRNPSHRSVHQLWDFLNHCGIPLTDDGCFLAYKGIRSNLKDKHTGCYDNKPGAMHEMPRNQVSDDPETPCHEGFHVGALRYAQGFGEVVVICKVDPEFVVSVPKDSSCEKMRVCKYTVEGFYGSQLSDTLHSEDEDEMDDDTVGDQEYFDFSDDDFTYSKAGRILGVSDDDFTDSDLAEGAHLPEPVKIAKKWAKYQEMGTAELLALSIETLRQYAHKALKIVGASKIPGGKVSLISRIIDVRQAIKGGE